MDRSYTIQLKARWVRNAALVAVTALVALPVGALAADRFDDVPDSNVFHDDISWLADADVTRGCNPPANTEFCPSDEVTREQMAAFMHRLAINQVVDAGSLEGHTAADLSPILSYDSTAANVDFPGDFDVITVKSVSVEAPEGSGGAVLVEAQGDIVGNGATVDEDHVYACWISTDPASTESNLGAHWSVGAGTPIPNNVLFFNFSTSHAVELDAAESATFYLLCRDTAGNGGNLFRVSNAQLSATFLPGEGHSVVVES
jgi:hypothetical protein